MAKFWREWVSLLIRPWTWVKGVIGVWKTILGAGVTLTGAVAVINEFRQSCVTMPWWVLLVLVLVGGYLLFTAGMAKARANGLSLRVVEFVLDPTRRQFVIRLENTCRKSLRFQVQVTAIRGSAGQRIDIDSFTAYWRDCPDPLVPNLLPSHTATVAVLMSLTSPAPANQRGVFACLAGGSPKPLMSSGEKVLCGPLVLDLSISYRSDTGEYGGTHSRTYRVATDTDALDGNRVLDA